jgi:hypothetical protein
MESFVFWQKWLLVVGVIISVFGIVMALFNGTVLFELFNSQIDPVFWGTGKVADESKGFQQWIYGVLGATVAGWGISLAFIAYHPFQKKERWSWNCLVVGLLVWFLTDTAISLYFKVYFNAAFNTLVLILAMLPVAFTRKHFSE